MAGMSISGLASGLDTTTIVSQLMQLEAQPQRMLATKLTDTKADASAYRTVNSVFTTLRSAAEALTKSDAWAPAKASAGGSTTVATSSKAGATLGSVSFTVEKLAATHSVISAASWTPSSSAMTLTITDADNDKPATTVPLSENATLEQAIAAINGANAGVTASAVNTGAGFRLQLSASTSGTDGKFVVAGGPAFDALSEGQDAELKIAGGAFTATSSSNTFSDLMAGTTFTVSKQGEAATVTVASDPSAVTTAVQALVTAANSALSTISEYSNNKPGSTAVLRGDSSLRALTGQIVDAVTFAIGDRLSAAGAGIQLSRDGTKFEFAADTFTAALKADPAMAQRLVNGSAAGDAAVPGVAQRLLAVAKRATDTTTGTLISLANGSDSKATDIQKRIDDWDLRLALREKTLTAQFSAMEKALSSLQNQSSWLSSQLASLPSWSKSEK